MELTSVTAAPTELCFGFVTKTVLVWFWLLLISGCTAQDFLHFQWDSWVGKMLGADTAGTADANYQRDIPSI